MVVISFSNMLSINKSNFTDQKIVIVGGGSNIPLMLGVQKSAMPFSMHKNVDV